MRSGFEDEVQESRCQRCRPKEETEEAAGDELRLERKNIPDEIRTGAQTRAGKCVRRRCRRQSSLEIWYREV